MPRHDALPRAYELMALFSPEVTDDDLNAAIDRVAGYVTAAGGEVTYTKRDTPWGRRRLAYPIERFRDAFYVLYHFNSSPSQIDAIERELKLDAQVIRYLLIRREDVEEVAEESEDGVAEAQPVGETGDEEPATVGTESQTAPAEESSGSA